MSKTGNSRSRRQTNFPLFAASYRVGDIHFARGMRSAPRAVAARVAVPRCGWRAGAREPRNKEAANEKSIK